MTQEQRERNIRLAEALESKQYRQGKSALRLGDSFCCLGVACDVFHKETGQGRWSKEEVDGFAIAESGSYTLLPPKEVSEWFGWTDTNPNLPTIGELGTCAANANDLGEPFENIAAGFRAIAGE